jgi:hypothetical protein
MERPMDPGEHGSRKQPPSGAELAERVLRTGLLAAHDAEAAGGPFDGLGRALAAIEAFFGRHSSRPPLSL